MRQLKIQTRITDRNSVGLEKYLNSVSQTPMITHEEEVALSKRILGGDNTAVEELAAANLRFVVSVAKQYQNRGMDLMDLISEGNVGVLKAATKFDHSRGFKFISYAVWWIRQSIQAALADHGRMIRMPANKINMISKINQATSVFEQTNERDPTPEELSDLTGFNVHDVKQSADNNFKLLSMDTPFSSYGSGSDNNTNLYDLIPSKDTATKADSFLVKESLGKEINRALASLTQTEKDVVTYFFGLENMDHPLLICEIAERLELSHERIRQIKEKAIRKLKHVSRNKILKEYL